MDRKGDGEVRGRTGKQRGAKYLGQAGRGFGSTRGKGGMAGGGKFVWEQGAKLGIGKRIGGEGGGVWGVGGHLIWIGSSQPNVSVGSQHAW